MTTHEDNQGAVGTNQADDTSPQAMAKLEMQREMASTTFGNGITPFSNGSAFRLACNMADRLANSSIVPDAYRGNAADMLVVIDYATRLGLSPIALAQNMDVVKGRPGLRGSMIIGLINASPLFGRVEFEWVGEDSPGKDPAPDFGCRALVVDSASGKTLRGALIDWRMVVGEGWQKNAKWTTMREQMFMYRAASFWGRTHAPDVLLGLHTTEELEDVIEGDYRRVSASASRLNEMTEDREDGGQKDPSPEVKPAKPNRRKYEARKPPENVVVEKDVPGPDSDPLQDDDEEKQPNPPEHGENQPDGQAEAQPETGGEATTSASSSNFNLE